MVPASTLGQRRFRQGGARWAEEIMSVPLLPLLAQCLEECVAHVLKEVFLCLATEIGFEN